MSRPHEHAEAHLTPVTRNPLLWVFVVVAGLVAFATTFSYLGAFLDPDGNAKDLPLALVNKDEGAALAGEQVNFGDQVVDGVSAPNRQLGDAVKWTVLPSRQAALDGISKDAYFAALVVPGDFSARVLAIAQSSSGSPEPAVIEVLTNPASGAYAGTFSQTVATKAVEQVSEVTSGQLADFLTDSGVTVTPAAARVLGQPVEAKVTIAHPIGERGGRGIAPFYFAVVLSVAGVVGTVVVSSGIDFLTGEQDLNLLGHRLRGRSRSLSPGRAWRVKLVATLAMATLGGWFATWMAIGILGMSAGSAWKVGLFAMLGVTTSATITLTLLTAFGVAGELLAFFFAVVFGVPSAGGVYPVQALPSFFRFLHAWMPLRYLTDGSRALIYFNGADLGLTRAVVVLGGYAAGAVLLGSLLAWRIDRRVAG
ncbi:MAG: YhgE/Pip domain-containing protein [Acidimicrobiia bacterium]